MAKSDFENLPNNAVMILSFNTKGVLDDPKIEDTYFTHKKCVFNDTEFKARVEAVKNDYFDHYGNEEQRNDLKDGGLIYQFINTPWKPFTSAQTDAVEEIARDFLISKDDIVSFINNLSSEESVAADRVVYAYTNQAGLHLRISPDASKNEVKSMIDNLDEAMQAVYGGYKKRTKPPLYYDLIYAIFRAQAHGKSMPEIFDCLNSGELEQYSGRKRFKSLETMKNYYYKYRPKVST